MRSHKGITLIALIVTIVVLLILASISIKALTGDNGLINQAKNGKEASEISGEKEIINIAVTQAIEKDKRGELTKEALQKELDKQIGEGKTEVREAGEKIEVYFVEKKRYYEVDKEGKVAETSISIKFTLSHTEEVPTAGGNVSEIREGNVPIPTGFTYVEGTRDTGLVISDGEGNEFVWVPVNQNQKLTLDVTSKEDITEIKLIGPDGT